MISGTSLGLEIAVRILPVMCSISLLPMTSHAPFMAAAAAVLTCFLVSHIQAVTSGTISGSALPSCLGADSWKTHKHSSAMTRICHFFSTGRAAKMAGRRDFIAKGLMFLQIACAVSLALFLTAGLLLVACPKHAAKQSFVKASPSGAPSASALAVAKAARASASSFEPHLATRAPIPAARPDFSAPSALTASTMDGSSPSDKFSSLDSIDIVRKVY
mmetsp:Transcript_27530/g.56393  ORF Transcript_27530/g.56393 Transcript_27530/m.56393 type:complete len:217 (+) Transcript_27530:2767-3417(+)